MVVDAYSTCDFFLKPSHSTWLKFCLLNLELVLYTRISLLGGKSAIQAKDLNHALGIPSVSDY
jgi:hypothetical protein